MIIYKITNLINGKLYIGQTVRSLGKRWHEHCYKPVDKRRISKPAISIAINKYGVENFKIEIIEICSSIDEMNLKEPFYIEKFNSLFPMGYNIELGGKNKKMHSSTRQKLSKIKSGSRLTESHKQRIKESNHTSHSKLLEMNQLSAKSQSIPIKCNETNIIYKSLNDAARSLNIEQSDISRQLQGKRKKVKGMTFSRILENK